MNYSDCPALKASTESVPRPCKREATLPSIVSSSSTTFSPRCTCVFLSVFLSVCVSKNCQKILATFSRKIAVYELGRNRRLYEIFRGFLWIIFFAVNNRNRRTWSDIAATNPICWWRQRQRAGTMRFSFCVSCSAAVFSDWKKGFAISCRN